jgi:hypothetical protein
MTMDTWAVFFQDYWGWNQAAYHLVALGVLFVVVAAMFRRFLLGLCLILAGGYLSLSVFFMNNYPRYGFDILWAFAIVVAAGLFIAVLFYFAVFVRS